MSTVLDKIISIKNPKSPISEAYRGIRTSIEFSNIDEKMKYIEEKAERMSAIEDQVRILEAKLKNVQSQSGADTSADTMRRRAD